MQDLSVMMSASGSSQTSCARSLYVDLLCKISLSGSLHQDPVGPLVVQDLSVRISASGSCSRTSCARSLYEIRNRNFTTFRATDTHDLRRRLHFEIRNRNFTCIPRTRHARSPQKVALRNPKSQFHLHSAHSTRTISAEGCTSKSKNAISPAFRALDTHDLRRGLHFEIQKRNFTCISRTRHARSPQRVHISKPCFRSTAPATKS